MYVELVEAMREALAHVGQVFDLSADQFLATALEHPVDSKARNLKSACRHRTKRHPVHMEMKIPGASAGFIHVLEQKLSLSGWDSQLSWGGYSVRL